MDSIDCLSSHQGEDSEGIISRVFTSPLATRVNILDIEDNMPITRLATLNDTAHLRKYHAPFLRTRECVD